jgi:hypothetical protein
MEHLQRWMVIGIEVFAAKNPGTDGVLGVSCCFF